MATDGRGLQGRRSTVLGFKERRRAFLAGGLHLLNVEVVGARLLPLELPVAAEASPLALVRWLREPAVRKAHMARIGQDCFLPEEPPDWDAARPTDWVAAENQFIWIARFGDDASAPDPEVEFWELDGPGNPEVMLGARPLSELTARLFEDYPASELVVATRSMEADVADLLRLPGAVRVLAPGPEVPGVIGFDGLIFGDKWIARHRQVGRPGVWVHTSREHEQATRAQLDQIADDWAPSS